MPVTAPREVTSPSVAAPSRPATPPPAPAPAPAASAPARGGNDGFKPSAELTDTSPGQGSVSNLQKGFASWVPDWVHTALDVAGMVPGIGELADGANAALYTAKGDYANAAISAAAMIPGIGSAATGTRLATKAGKQVTEAAGENLLKMASNDLKPWLKGDPAGQALGAASSKTNKTAQGAQVYKVDDAVKLEGGAAFKKGDQYHLDTLHRDHLEVYNKRNNFTQAVNLDGKVNPAKTQAGLKEGRTLGD